MVIKCISIRPNVSQKELLPEAYRNADFHITENKEYLVLGIRFLLDSSVGRCSMVEISSDYGHLSSVPLFLFEIIDSSVSKYWKIKIFNEFTITLWPEAFYREYFHDDLSENIEEVVNDFKRIKLLLEDELKNPPISPPQFT